MKLKKFKVTWYEGSIHKIDKIIKEVEKEANNIRDISVDVVLPEKELKEVHYIRVITWNHKKITLDYGSHIGFIEIKEVK